MDYLETLDQAALLAINGWHGAYADRLMWCVSSRLSWLLIAVALLLVLRRDRRQALLVLAAVGLTVLVADQVASGLIKHLVERLRPTHAPGLTAGIHVVNGYRGGLYGFVSSHAANSFGVAAIVGLIMRHRRVTLALTLWALVQCYARMYLGVHYPGDILGGAVVGLLAGWAVCGVWRWVGRRWLRGRLPLFTRRDAGLLAGSVYLTLAFLTILALFGPI